MISVTDKARMVSTSEPTHTVDYHIDPRNIVHITQILRGMYAYPVRAVVREYCANAVDAHVQAGISEKPIVVTAPTRLEPVYKVRDFGPGLSQADTELLLCGYGSSGEAKRDAASGNKYIGGFGIGCKCAFSITDQFQYVIRHGGRKCVWSCYLDEHDMGKAKVMSEEDCDEPSGLEVLIPAKPEQVPQFQTELMDAFEYYKVMPELHAMDKPARGNPEYLASCKLRVAIGPGTEAQPVEWRMLPQFGRYISSDTRCSLVMGDIRYPIDPDQLDLSEAQGAYRSSDGENFKAFCDVVHIVAPIGFVQLAPNREALQYSGRTKAVLSKLFTVLVSDKTAGLLTGQLEVESGGSWEHKRQLAHTIRRIWPRLAKGERTAAINEQLWQGMVMLNAYGLPPSLLAKVKCRVAPELITIERRSRYIYGSGQSGYRSYFPLETRLVASPDGRHPGALLEGIAAKGPICVEVKTTIDQTVNGAFLWVRYLGEDVKADEAGTASAIPRQQAVAEGVINRLGGAAGFGTNSTTYTAGVVLGVWGSKDGWEQLKQEVPWLADGSAGILEDEDIPETVNAELFTEPRKGSSGSSSSRSRTPAARNAYAQHGKKFVVLNPKASVGYRSTSSQAWTAAAAKDIKDGVYIVHDRFEPLGWREDRRMLIQLPSLVTFWNEWAQPKGPLPAQLLGIRQKDRNSLPATEFVTLWSYLQKLYQRAYDTKVCTPEAVLCEFVENSFAQDATSPMKLVWALWKTQAEHPESKGSVLEATMRKWLDYSSVNVTGKGRQLAKMAVALAELLGKDEVVTEKGWLFGTGAPPADLVSLAIPPGTRKLFFPLAGKTATATSQFHDDVELLLETYPVFKGWFLEDEDWRRSTGGVQHPDRPRSAAVLPDCIADLDLLCYIGWKKHKGNRGDGTGGELGVETAVKGDG